jgi:hypothetical protein
MFPTAFWILVAAGVGFWWGCKVTAVVWKGAYKAYAEEMYEQYTEALRVMRIKYINQNNPCLKEDINQNEMGPETDHAATA